MKKLKICFFIISVFTISILESANQVTQTERKELSWWRTLWGKIAGPSVDTSKVAVAPALPQPQPPAAPALPAKIAAPAPKIVAPPVPAAKAAAPAVPAKIPTTPQAQVTTNTGKHLLYDENGQPRGYNSIDFTNLPNTDPSTLPLNTIITANTDDANVDFEQKSRLVLILQDPTTGHFYVAYETLHPNISDPFATALEAQQYALNFLQKPIVQENKRVLTQAELQRLQAKRERHEASNFRLHIPKR